uniref:Uncharacterized protein n=1 Tax=Arion vulgaris TaxID=1028688 RepID=A0A0B7BD06_9EUPU
MAGVASMSESMQVSIAIQRQEDLLLGTHLSQQQQQQQQKGFGYCKQILLVMAVCGMEMCMTFEQIYQILILQYLGVPLYLVSLNGVICGLTSMALIPVIGFVTDGGSNPKRRKMASLFVGMAMFQIGLLLLLISGLIKIQDLKYIQQLLGTSSTLSTPITGTVSSVTNQYTDDLYANNSNGNSSVNVWNNTNLTVTANDDYKARFESGLPLTGYLSICGFAFVDIGYDSTMAVSRAYILESMPKFQHVKILVMATIVQASSGTLLSLLGVLDISDALGNAFNVDGTSAILVFFCALLLFVVTLGFTSTTITGHYLSKSMDLTNKEMEACKPTMIIKTTIMEDKPVVSRHRYYKIEDLVTDSTDASKKSLIHDNSSENNYGTLNNSSSFSNSNNNLDNDVKSSRNSRSYKLHRSLTKDGKAHGIAKSRTTSHSEMVPEVDESNYDEKSLISSQISEHTDAEQEPEPTPATFDTTKHNLSRQSQEGNKNGGKPKIIKRFIVLCISSFFTIGSSIAFLCYSANAMTLGIFKGDPMALPGTEGKNLYEKGLRTAALGNLTFYILFTVTSLVNTKLLDIVGEKLLFIIFHLIFATPLAALVTTQTLEAYFATIVTMGVFRHTVYTIPFVMANKIAQEASAETGKPQDKKSNIGRTMSLIGFLIPTHYLIISAMTGPLIEATANVWIPLMYSLGCACVSVIVFSLMFILK